MGYQLEFLFLIFLLLDKVRHKSSTLLANFHVPKLRQFARSQDGEQSFLGGS